ncbi:molybdopterin-dependent oxidoreductase [Oceanisphaera sp.]|uniref:molybdopterin-dependent oxidoreductase n=1 Tax=Oceanisphaera sp. TaxID=1929979 RepID=UPI003A919EB6
MKPAIASTRGRRFFPTFFLVLLVSAWSSQLFAADPLPAPQGRVILTVTGNLAVTNAGDNAEFDMEMLSALPQHEFTTTTPWTDGPHHFRGVLLRDLLQRVGGEGAEEREIRAMALNNYHYDIKKEQVAELPLLLTTHLDGQPMKIRHKGPVWLMLPLSDNPSLNTKPNQELLIWQLKTLEIR